MSRRVGRLVGEWVGGWMDGLHLKFYVSPQESSRHSQKSCSRWVLPRMPKTHCSVPTASSLPMPEASPEMPRRSCAKMHKSYGCNLQASVVPRRTTSHTNIESTPPNPPPPDRHSPEEWHNKSACSFPQRAFHRGSPGGWCYRGELFAPTTSTATWAGRCADRAGWPRC